MTSQETAAPLSQISASTAIPEAPRVLYARNPLAEVIGQIRFPAILKIDAQSPANFQERIRDSFPLLSEEEEFLSFEAPPELLQYFKANLSPKVARRAWKFMSEDRKWTISLTRDFAALATEEYTRWEDFRAKLELMCQALQEEYRPSFATRIGLRYRDLIIRSNLGLAGVPWSELLATHIAGEYARQPFADAVREAARVLVAEFSVENMKLGLRHGTAHKEGSDEIGYLIDSDFYTEEKTEVTNVLDRLDSFNRLAGRLFRWCITNELHTAMGPQPVP
jgi:uncharacterized protein (TIGR04255 family)